jgi:3-methylcrotonyl-CoA carboxylase alpha subunit
MRKLLIANRGEIACRIIATARRMGLATVAVHSDADAGARHVAMADEAMHIGPAEAAQSYLDQQALLAAARQTGADAVHPGYGFLSENAEFAEAVEGAGLTWVGPPPAAIRAMGLKDAAKARMEAAGVPVVPGYHGAAQEVEVLAEEAALIGYPVLIKARAGGGGKGMRRVDRAEDFAAALRAAQGEARAAFGDPACLIEKYVTHPRHVEIQVFADSHGNVVHLFERDCSLQRRHQKVIEEAPAPGMPEAVRDAMGEAAVEAARAIGYVGAGTVEFIADGRGGLKPDGFWFMEMNTRLQVEHPVSEAITGLDFVELQLKIAAGEALPFAQDDLRIDGHAFEARIYAEDPARGFLPATGTLERLRFPASAAFAPGSVRVDSGVGEGDEISPHYDPMIAKLIVHAADRPAALARLSRALEETQIAGLTTNLDFLARLAAHEGFAAGEVDTGLIDRAGEALTAPAAPAPWLTGLAAVLAARGPGGPLADWRAWGPADRLVALVPPGGEETRLRVTALGGGRWRVQLGEEEIALDVSGDDPVAVRHAGRRDTVAVLGPGPVLRHGGRTFRFAQPDLLHETEVEAGGDVVTAPMPGTVRSTHVAEGEAVEKGAPVAVLEAMKMEHTLTAPRDGHVAELLVTAGDRVSDGSVIAKLAPEDP